MTEKEWLKAKTIIDLDLWRSAKNQHRKWRLFAVACCRSALPLCPEPWHRETFEQTERIADGPAPDYPALGIPEANLALVRQGMIDVVNAGYGTARAARSPLTPSTSGGFWPLLGFGRITCVRRPSRS